MFNDYSQEVMYKVIKTINVKTQDYYLGVIKSDTEQFDGQLGQGIEIRDPNTYQFSKTRFQWAVKTDGVKAFRVNVLQTFNSAKEAYSYLKEILTPEIVATKKCYNNCYPTKISNAYIYDVNGNFIDELNNPLDFDEVLNGLKKGNYYICPLYDEKGFSKAKKMNIQNRKVYKYDINGNFMEEYETQTLAEKRNKYSNITKAIKLKEPCRNGFFWSLQRLPKLNWKDKKWVQKYDLEGNYIRGYKFIKECRREEHIEGVLKDLIVDGFKYNYA